MVVSVEVQTKIPIFGWTIVCNRMQRTVFREVNGRFGRYRVVNFLIMEKQQASEWFTGEFRRRIQITLGSMTVGCGS